MNKKLLYLYIFFSGCYLFSQQPYYNGIDFSKNGIALKNDLATLIINSHTNYLVYTPGVWEACKATDVNPENSNQVLLLYGYSSSGITAKTRGINQNGGNVGDWNREHTYPKALGNPNLGTSGPGSDAHHLRPTDVQYNGQRGSKKFVDGSGNSGGINGGWFPGDEWKGDVARMMMYMYLRYGSQCLPSVVGNGSSSQTPDDMIDLFLKWNAQDPVSAVEDQRNTYHGNTDNTYAQGNRNPFIDNPRLATKIWGNPPSGINQPEDRWGTLSISKTQDLSSINIYPNPSNTNSVTVNLPNSIKITSISLYSLIGSRVYNNSSVDESKVKIENLKSGIYLLKINTENKSITKKVIIK